MVIVFICGFLYVNSIFIAVSQIGQLKISLKSVQDKWSQYKQASEEINSYLTEGRYSVSRYRLLTGSLEASRLQVESLQVKHVPVHLQIMDLKWKNVSYCFL